MWSDSLTQLWLPAERSHTESPVATQTELASRLQLRGCVCFFSSDDAVLFILYLFIRFVRLNPSYELRSHRSPWCDDVPRITNPERYSEAFWAWCLMSCTQLWQSRRRWDVDSSRSVFEDSNRRHSQFSPHPCPTGECKSESTAIKCWQKKM